MANGTALAATRRRPTTTLSAMPAADRVSPRRRRRRLRWLNGGLLAIAIGAAGASGVVTATNNKTDDVATVPVLSGVIDEKPTGWQNYLLVGSDTRAGANPDDPDFGGIGDASEVTGQRSDTIMILHVDHDAGRASLVSLPRDLWVPIDGGDSDRINSAYSEGADVLVRTVQGSLGVPIHHYVEVDFNGFKRLVDAIGGVNVCFEYATRDGNTGLSIPGKGCYVLEGVDALAYARSRHFEQFVDGEWREDPTQDLGRTLRQQQLIADAAAAVIDKAASNPLALNKIVDAAIASLTVDPQTNVLTAAAELQPLANGGFDRYQLPVRGTEVDGNSVLELDDGAQAILDYFSGVGPKPPPAAS